MGDAVAVPHDMDVEVRLHPVDRAIARLAGRQHGIVARRQLRALGLGRGAIEHRLACGRLHALHRGVYAVGHRALSLEARRLAAVLAAGPGAVLSHSAAGAHWGIVTSGTRIDVTVPRRPHARRGFRLHHAVLPADETTVHRAIAVTTVPRTILDLAAILPSYRLERAVSEAERLRLWDARSLHDLIGRYPRRPGTPALRAVLARGVAPTRSDLEAAFLGFLDAHGLPRPDVNTPTGGREVDCRWRRQRLIAEVDGGGVHGTRAAFERDRARDRALVVAGWRVVRVTWRQLHDDPAALAAEFRALLAKYP